MRERFKADLDDECYYLDGKYFESWDNFGEEMADKLNKFLEKENNKFEVKLDFIMNFLFTIYTHVDVHSVEMLGYYLGEAEQLGFNVAPSKSFDYEEDSYEYARKHKKAIEEYMRYED